MVYLCAILILLSPIILGFLTSVFKLKSPIYNYFLSFFVPFQILLSPFTITKVINYEAYMIMTYIIFAIFFCSVIGYTIYWCVKKQYKFIWKDILRENYDNLVLFGVMLISLILILFTWYSWHASHDLNYYINISKNFQYSIYSSGPNIFDNNNLISTLPNYYLSPQMYYTYSAFFINDISLSYMLLNPLIYVLLICMFTKELMRHIFKNINIFVMALACCTTMFVSVSSLYFSATGGNVAIQSLVLILLIANLILDKQNNLFTYCPFFALGFFSSTGLMLGLIPIFIIGIWRLFKNGYNSLYYSIPVLILMLFLNCISLTQLIQSKAIIITGYVICLLLLICGTGYFYYQLTKNKEVKKIKLSWFKFNQYWFWSIIIAMAVIICLTSLTNLWFNEQFFGKLYYQKNFAYLYIVLMLIIGAIWYYDWKKTNKMNYVCLSIFLISLLSTLELLISSQVFYSLSSWRLIYLSLGLGNIPDTVIICFFTITAIIQRIVKNKKISDTTIVTKVRTNKRIQITFYSILSLLLSSTTMIASYTSIFIKNTVHQTFNANVTYNLKFATNHDINLLKSIDFNNWEKTYITDMPIYQYLHKATDLTGYINYDGSNKPSPSYNWNFYNFYYGIPYWNDVNPNDKMQENPDDLINGINQIINNVNQWNLTNVNGNNINQLDYVILNKNTPYFDSLYNSLSTTFTNVQNGEQIVILGR